MIPATRYTNSNGADIAYKVVGDGALDLVISMPFVSHLDILWENENFVNVFEQATKWSRIISFDRRGTGLSDRRLHGITAEQRSDDVIAVMDAAGSERAVLMGFHDSAAISLLTAARHPDRVAAVVAGEALAVGHPDAEHPYGMDKARLKTLLRTVRSGAWGTGILTSTMIPDAPIPPERRAWIARYESMSATPSAVAELLTMNADLDLRPHLAKIQAPVLLLHDGAFPLVPFEGIRWLAEHLPDARLKETSMLSSRGLGRPLAYVMDEVEEFLLGTRVAANAARQVSTLLVADVVKSTQTAATVGDHGWKSLLADFRRVVRFSLARFGRTEIDTAGDGFLAAFPLPSSALRCGSDIATEAAQLGIDAGCRASGEV